MADELIQINNNKENILEFDLTTEGVSADTVSAKFVIKSSGMELGFPCTRGDDGKWSVKLPPLPMLERTAYPFHFAITAEGYHFQPLKGNVNVVGSTDVYVSAPKNVKLESPIKPVVEKREIKEVSVTRPLPTKSREKGIEQIAKEMLEVEKQKNQVSQPSAAKKPETMLTELTSLLPKIDIEEKPKGSKDEATLRVLEELGHKVKKPKKRFSLKS